MRGGMLVATARKKKHLKEGRAAGCTPPPRWDTRLEKEMRERDPPNQKKLVPNKT